MSTPDSEQRALLLIIAATLTLFLNGCTTVYYPNGKVAIRAGSDFTSLTSTGDTITIIGHRPSTTVRSYGSVGGTVLSGAALFRPMP